MRTAVGGVLMCQRRGSISSWLTAAAVSADSEKTALTIRSLGKDEWVTWHLQSTQNVNPRPTRRLEAPSRTPSPHMVTYPSWEQISSLIILVSTRLGNTPRIENTESNSWKPLRSSSGHALDDDDTCKLNKMLGRKRLGRGVAVEQIGRKEDRRREMEE